NTQTHQALQAPTPAKGTHGANREQHAHFFDDNERCTSLTGGG
ncbi:copper resistance protein CopC, partial [Schaalia cardiffensis F0333]